MGNSQDALEPCLESGDIDTKTSLFNDWSLLTQISDERSDSITVSSLSLLPVSFTFSFHSSLFAFMFLVFALLLSNLCKIGRTPWELNFINLRICKFCIDVTKTH